jgi:hypothetical protein
VVNYYVNKSVVLWAQRLFAPASPSDAAFGCIRIFRLRTRSRTPLLARFGYALLARSLAFLLARLLTFALESITSNCNDFSVYHAIFELSSSDLNPGPHFC